MTRKQDLQQFFISANSSQERHDFNLDKFTDEYLKRNPIEQIDKEELNPYSYKAKWVKNNNNY